MPRYRAVLVPSGLLAAILVTGCSGGGDYVTRKEFTALEQKYIATHDTLVGLWETLEKMVVLPEGLDTIPIPRCKPPRCTWPHAPERYEPAPVR